MSIFASFTQATIPIPFDPPHTVTLQKLTGRQLARAGEESLVEAQAYVARMGGAEFRKQLAEVGDGDAVKEAVAKAQADPMSGYHKPTLIKHGLKAWSYDRAIDDAAIEDLDDDALEFLSREVLKLTKPALFEADPKNDSGSSTAA
jgi:hypothetical protein